MQGHTLMAVIGTMAAYSYPLALAAPWNASVQIDNNVVAVKIVSAASANKTANHPQRV